jgi:RNA polymerase sigma factor (sigma-70 family)
VFGSCTWIGGALACSVANDNDAAAWFESRVLPHERAAVRLLTRFCNDPDEVEDLLQQAYVKVLEAARRDAILYPRAFLLKTTHHVAIDHLRSRRVVPFTPVSETEYLHFSSPEPGPEQTAIGRNLLGVVIQAIAALPPRCRDVFLLRKIDGLSQREVAERLRIAEATVQKQVAKGVRICARALFRGSEDASEVSAELARGPSTRDADER